MQNIDFVVILWQDHKITYDFSLCKQKSSALTEEVVQDGGIGRPQLTSSVNTLHLHLQTEQFFMKNN